MAYEVTVDGRWLSSVCTWGELEVSTVWPGGCGEASWSAIRMPARLQTAGLSVQVWDGPWCFWNGRLTEPDATSDRVVAEGAWKAAGEFLALDSDDAPTNVVDDAIDAAITRGLPWRRLRSFSTTATDIDVSQGPVYLGALLDAYALDAGQRWGVAPDKRLVCQGDPTDPDYHLLGVEGGVGTARDDYASTLVGVYNDGSGYAITTASDTHAETRHGHVESAVDLTPRGAITLTKADNILAKALALYRGKPQWRDPIEVTYGELLGKGGAPIGLNRVRAGGLLRIHTTFDDTNALDGRMWLDVQVGETHLSGGRLTITPLNAAPTTLTDIVVSLTEKRR